MSRKNKGWASWVHHNRLLEFCTDYNGRLEVIQKNKSQSEIPGRLAAFQWWRGEIPKKIIKAWAASEKAWVAYEKAWVASKKAWAASELRAASEKAWAAYEKARASYEKAYKDCYPTLVNQFRKAHPEIEFDEQKEILKL